MNKLEITNPLGALTLLELFYCYAVGNNVECDEAYWMSYSGSPNCLCVLSYKDLIISIKAR